MKTQTFEFPTFRRCHVAPRLAVVCCSLLAIIAMATVSQAAIFFDLPEVMVMSDGVNPTLGSFDVLVKTTEPELSSMPAVSEFEIDFDVLDDPVHGTTAAFVTLGPPGPPTVTSLLTGGIVVDLSAVPQNIRALRNEDPASNPLINGRGLINVPFSIGSGVVGTFPLRFEQFAPTNRIVTAGGDALEIELRGGFIRVFVPEPATIGLFTAAIAGVLCVRRRRNG